MRVATVIAAAASLVAGCSLLVDVGSYTAGGHALDAAGSMDTNEASPLLDGAPGDAANASAPQGCAHYADASFCHDFDDSKTALSPFVLNSYSPDGSAGTITLVADAAVSPPNAARFVLTSSASDNCGARLLTRAFGGLFHTLTARVSVRAETEGIPLVVVAAQPGFEPRSYRVILTIRRTPVSATLEAFVQQFESGSFSTFYRSSVALDDDPFVRSLDLKVEMATLPTPSIVVHGWDRSLVLTAPADLAISDPDIEIGPYCAPAGTTFTYDDLAIWVAP